MKTAEEILREHNVGTDEPNFITKLCLSMNAKISNAKLETMNEEIGMHTEQDLVICSNSETKNNIPARQDMTDRLSDRNVSPTDEKIKTFITDRGNVYEIVTMVRYSGGKDIGERLTKGMFIPDDIDWKMFDMNVSGNNRLLCITKRVGVQIFNIPIDPIENESDREVVQDLLTR